MEDLLQSQIRDSCRLALPEGLKDLMADISREVLRAQPQNLYQFIADYLSVLLVAREHLFVASRVCDDLCKDHCWRDLEDELRQLSLSEEDIKEILKVVEKYFSSDEVNEGNLLQKLTQKTSIEQNELPAVQDAIRCAFLRYRLGSSASNESPSADSELDETTRAANHTLKIYQKATEDPDVNYDCVASKIQAAYRAYNVRRKREQPPTHSRKSNEKVRFTDKQEKLTADLFKKCSSKCSSMSLAGSFMSLPLYRPYSVASDQQDHSEVDEIGDKERERINIDYVAHADARDQQGVNDADKKAKKSISFHNLLKVVEVDYDVVDESREADYESDDIDEELGVVEEAIDGVFSDNETQDNGDDVAKTNTVGFTDVTGAEVRSYCGSESSADDSDDNNDLFSSKMQRISKNAVINDQGNSHNNAQKSMAVNTHDGGRQYSLEIRPDDDDKNLKQLVRAVSGEIETSKSPTNAKRSTIRVRDDDDHAEDVDKKGSKKTISFDSLPKVVEVDYGEVEDVADEADYESEEVEEDELDVIEERMVKASGNNLDEQQGNGDDMAKTDSLVGSELAGDESDLNESSLEENDDGHDLQQSEMERISKITVAHNVQAHSHDNAQEILDSMAVNTDEGDKQYKSTSFEIMPDDDMTELLRAVSDEIDEITKSQINE